MTKYLTIVSGFVAFTLLVSLVGKGVTAGDTGIMAKGVIVGDKS